MNSNKRKYNDSILSFGFTFIINNNIEIPQCVVYNATLSKESFKN